MLLRCRRVKPHLIWPVPKEFALLKFKLALVLRFTPPANVLLPYRESVPAVPLNAPCQTTGVTASPPIGAVISRFWVFIPPTKDSLSARVGEKR